jgi:GNAT superfamily N-acetyltransferase
MTTPATEEHLVTLRDGRRVLLRPIRRDDAAATTQFLEGLSSSSKHFLFLGAIARLSDAELARLCDPDHGQDMAYVAVAADASEREIGLCRYAGAGGAEGAEISVAVADEWQHRGLGTLLLKRLIAYAREHGVRRLYSMDSIANEPMRRLARELGFVETRDREDPHQAIYSLEP